ncbi:hypothetical protein NPX90_26165 [Bacillus paranthracis]|uniref:hypothetical protein n=1 Tax=Bacillus paranthracis TaxID=2026186 RepID=UPI0021114D96|nr:hypothetical protein [Bacillus paranthracis]MCQ6524974.1 hypothetical protein [Bacillus paranthracis]
MGIGQKVANELIDIAGSLVKRGVNDMYSIGKIVVKHSFKTTFQLAKHTTKFSYQAIKYFSKKAKEYHAEKQLTKQKSMVIDPPAKYNAKFNQYMQQPQQVQQVQQQKQNNVIQTEYFAQQRKQQKAAEVQQVSSQKQVQQQPKQQVQQQKVSYAQQYQKETNKPMFHQRHVHDHELKNVQMFHQDLIDSGYVKGKELEEVKKIATLLREERQMLSKNKEYKSSEYAAHYDYVNNSDKGKKVGIKEAVKTGDLKTFKNEYTDRLQIVKADVSSYYQKIEQTTNLEEKAFWAGRMENFVAFHKQVFKGSGLGEEVREMKENKPSLSKTELLEEKLKRIEGLKKGIKHNEEIQKKVDGMKPGTLLRNALEGKLGPSVLDTDLFFKTDKDKQEYREKRAQQKIEQKKAAGKEMYF